MWIAVIVLRLKGIVKQWYIFLFTIACIGKNSRSPAVIQPNIEKRVISTQML